MRNINSHYNEDGVIYFTGIVTQPLALTGDRGSLSGDLGTLRNYDFTLIGGWNGDTNYPIFSGQTSLAVMPIQSTNLY